MDLVVSQPLYCLCHLSVFIDHRRYNHFRLVVCLVVLPIWHYQQQLNCSNSSTLTTLDNSTMIAFNCVMFHMIKLDCGQNVIMINSVYLQQSTHHKNCGMLTSLYSYRLCHQILFPPPQRKMEKKRSGNARLLYLAN